MIRVIEAHRLECYFEVKNGYMIFFFFCISTKIWFTYCNAISCSLNLELPKEGLKTKKSGLNDKIIPRSVYIMIIYIISHFRKFKIMLDWRTLNCNLSNICPQKKSNINKEKCVTWERRQIKDCMWFLLTESPTNAMVLPLTISRNRNGSKTGKPSSHP